MKILKIIRMVIYKIYDIYSYLFDKVFECFLGCGKSYNLQDMYCIESYMLTPGGVIVRIDD